MKKVIPVILLCLVSLQLGAQTRFIDRLYFGGGLGLQFGTITAIDISPLVGYKITERFSAGIGGTYIYFRAPGFRSTDIYGGRVFSRYMILENLFAYTEYELLNREVYDDFEGLRRMNVSGVYVGGGYFMPVGRNAGVGLMLLYNLNETRYSLYNNPIFRLGFNIGL
jgi:hypothetical protein